MNEWNQKIIEEFRANGGVVGGPFEGASMILVHHTGARSGTERVTPLVYRAEGDDFAVFASKAGAPDNPDWYHNLMANPRVTVEVGTDAGVEVIGVEAVEVSGAERDRIFEAQKAASPQFAEYEKNTTRTIPVVALRRV